MSNQMTNRQVDVLKAIIESESGQFDMCFTNLLKLLEESCSQRMEIDESNSQITSSLISPSKKEHKY